MHNYITDPSHPADDSGATQIQNVAEQNACLVGQNQSTGDGVVGVYGESDGCRGSIGVGGSAAGWAVAGIASAAPVDVLNNSNVPNFSPYPSNVGVFGAGDNYGVYGQNRASGNQAATSLPAPGSVGVYGVGDTAGVQGDNDQVDPDGDDVGTGVIGTSIQGVGILGQGVGSADPTASIPPYVGVYGVSQATPRLPYPVAAELQGTGVLGIGDEIGVMGIGGVRGAVFTSTAEITADAAANVQLTPRRFETEKLASPQYVPATELPALPAHGRPGDVLAVETRDGDGRETVELWVCIRPTGTVGDHTVAQSSWARIHYDTVVVGST